MSSSSISSISSSLKSLGNLRFICVNDVYRPEMYSVFKTLIPSYKGIGITKTVLPGDFLGGSLFGSKSSGEGVLKVLNEVNFDYVTVGNHGKNTLSFFHFFFFLPSF